jgi:hypothetical protein
MLLPKAVDRRQIFVTLKQLKKNLRIFYAKFWAVNAYLNGACPASEAADIFKELSDFCESEFADFKLRAKDLQEYAPTETELAKVMAAVKKSWAAADRLSVDECKTAAAEAIAAMRDKKICRP